jgi:hypothetical protein
MVGNRRERLRGVLLRALVAGLLAGVAGSVVGCSAWGTGTAHRGVAPTVTTQRATAVDAQAAKSAVLAYIEAVRSGDATKAAGLMTRYRRAEVRERGWRSANAWWKAARITTVSRPGHYLTDERSFARLYLERFGREPFKLVVLNVGYSAVASAPAGDLDFVVTQDVAHGPWLIHDFGGAVFPH